MERKNDGKCEWKGTTRKGRSCTALLIDIDVSSQGEMSTSYYENITPKNRFQLKERQIKKEGEGERNYTEKEIS